jgi:hypothetical protein
MAGAVSSMAVGAALSLVGAALAHGGPPRGAMVLAIGIAALAAFREAGWITLRLPQPKRQTKDVWARVFSRPVAAMLWGFDVGLIFTTWFTFSGTWLLVVLALLGGEPAFGATLFLGYWLGRVLSVWVAPVLMEDANATPTLLALIAQNSRALQLTHVVALIFSVAVLAAVAISGGHL